MSDFSKSIVYSGLVLVAGLIAIFAISSNMTTQQPGAEFAAIQPAAGEEQTPITSPNEATAAAEQTAEKSAWESDEALTKLREALKEAGVDIENVENIEPSAGEEATQAPTINDNAANAASEPTATDETTGSAE